MREVEGRSIRAIVRRTGHDRNTVRRALRRPGPPRYERPARPSKLDPFRAEIHRLLDDDAEIPGKWVRELLEELGYEGAKTILDDYLREIRPPRPRGAHLPAHHLARRARPVRRLGARPRHPRRLRAAAPGLRRGGLRAVVRAGTGALVFFKQAPDLCWRMARCLAALGALPEKLVWDREGALHAGDGRPTDAFAPPVPRAQGAGRRPPGRWRSSRSGPARRSGATSASVRRCSPPRSQRASSTAARRASRPPASRPARRSRSSISASSARSESRWSRTSASSTSCTPGRTSSCWGRRGPARTPGDRDRDQGVPGRPAGRLRDRDRVGGAARRGQAPGQARGRAAAPRLRPARRRRRGRRHPLRPRGGQPNVLARLRPLRAGVLDRHLEQAVLGLGEIFGDEVIAAAMIDRLVHHAEILALKGDSYRLRGKDLGARPAAEPAEIG